jgi:hypothetical protein
MYKTLSKEAQTVIDTYIKLPIGAGCSTPYYNNRRGKIRAGLNAIIGKGTPKEICDEAQIASLHRNVSIRKASPDELKHFLVDVGLGIDCSGFAFHVLNAESKARGLGALFPHLVLKKGIIRRTLARLRPASNVGVGIFSMDENSMPVEYADIEAGDFFSIIGSGLDHTYNHIMVITKVNGNTLSYSHSYAWPSDGKYGHGIKNGIVTIIDPTKPITDQQWNENGTTGQSNYTLQNALMARKVSIRRLNHLA